MERTSKIVVTELPKRRGDCPCYSPYPYNKCEVGGDCSYYKDASKDCDRLIALKDALT